MSLDYNIDYKDYIENKYSNRFKFDLTTYDPNTFTPCYKFRDTHTNKKYEIKGFASNVIELVESIIVETRNNKIEDLGI